MARPRKGSLLDAIWREKMHVEADALESAPNHVRMRYRHIWEPPRVLMAELERLPAGLLALWAESPTGHLVYTHTESRYVPGKVFWKDARERQHLLESVAYIGVVDLVTDLPKAMRAVCRLCDHLMGNGAIGRTGFFSDGQGQNDALCQAAQRFLRVYALGYACDTFPCENAQDYLAYTWVAYLYEPQQLNVIDPLVYRLYRHTLMAEAFWARMLG